MAVIGWDESSPPDNEAISLGDDRIRSLKTSLRQGLDDEHLWPSAGGDAGKHRLGSARAFVGPESLVSSSGTEGRLYVTSDTSRFFHVGSAGTMLLGDQAGISASSSPVGGQNYHWVNDFGETQVFDNGGGVTINFLNSGFSGRPYVTYSVWGVTSATNVIRMTAITPTSFSLGASETNSTFSVIWQSLGTRVL